MAFAFMPENRYRMPVVFGPMPGPRQRPGGGRFTSSTARVEIVTASFLTEARFLERLLPPGFTLDGEPVVTIEYMFMSELLWLAGRGYNTLGVRFPVRYQGRSEALRGPFLAVLWENKADPIITGREELGFSKLFCDIPQPQILGDRRVYGASWEGHGFLEVELTGMGTAPFSPQPNDGVLHYRYLPRVGVSGEADFAGAVVSPPGASFELIDHQVGKGSIRFRESTWEQLPTLAHIVNCISAFPIIEERSATITNCRRDVELANHRIVDAEVEQPDRS